MNETPKRRLTLVPAFQESERKPAAVKAKDAAQQHADQECRHPRSPDRHLREDDRFCPHGLD